MFKNSVDEFEQRREESMICLIREQKARSRHGREELYYL